MNSFLEKIICENFIKILTIIAFTPGVLCFLVYYSHIAYLPKITFFAALTFLFCVSMTSVLAVAFMGFGLIFPGFIWQVATEENKYIKKLLRARGKLPKSKYQKLGRDLVYNRRVIYWIAVPNALLSISFLVWFFESKGLGYLLAFLTGALLFFGCRGSWKRYLKPFMILGGLSLISFVLVVIPAFIMLSLLFKTGEKLSVGEMFYVITAIIILFEANVGAAFIPRIREGKFNFLKNIVFSAIVFVVVVAMLGKVTYIPARMMEIYKMGNLEADKIV